MNDTNSREDKVKCAFAMYPDTNNLYAASDYRLFFTPHEADAYAQKLADKNVQEFTKDGDGGLTATGIVTDPAKEPETAKEPEPVKEPDVKEPDVKELEAVKEPEAEKKTAAKKSNSPKNK